VEHGFKLTKNQNVYSNYMLYLHCIICKLTS